MANNIVSLFESEADAQAVIGELGAAGFGSAQTLTRGGGNIDQALTNASVPAEAARFYAEGVRRGGTLVTLHVEDAEVDRALEIIERHNAVDIDERAEQYRTGGYTDFEMGEARRAGTGEAVLPVIEEELQIGKRAVQRGGVRVYSRVTERPVEETVTLREEQVHVERRPVDREVSAADLANLKDGTLEVTTMAEEAVVGKQARVVEEVVVGKETVAHEETIRDTVRRTDVEVEEVSGTTDVGSTDRARGKANT